MAWMVKAREILHGCLDEFEVKVLRLCCGLEPGPSAMRSLGIAAEFFSWDSNPLLRTQILHASEIAGNVYCGDVSGNIEEMDLQSIPEVDCLVAAPPFEKYLDPVDSENKFCRSRRRSLHAHHKGSPYHQVLGRENV
eukprot:165730-Pyramimonas_sp.AAC.1